MNFHEAIMKDTQDANALLIASTDANSGLWNSEFCPPGSLLVSKDPDWPGCAIQRLEHNVAESVIQSLLEWRRHVAARQQMPFNSFSFVDCLSRAFLYYPYWTMSDGIAAADSGGFFDDQNCPAWESWVGYVRNPKKPSNDAMLFIADRNRLQSIRQSASLIAEMCVQYIGAWIAGSEHDGRVLVDRINAFDPFR